MVQYRARFEKFLAYVDVAKDLDDVIDAFITGLKSSLVGGRGSCGALRRPGPSLSGPSLSWSGTWEGQPPRPRRSDVLPVRTSSQTPGVEAHVRSAQSRQGSASS